MRLIAIRGKTEWPRRVSVSLTLGFDSHRLHQEALVATLPSPYPSEVAFGVPEVPVHLQTKPELR